MIETYMFQKIIADSWEEMSVEEQRELLGQIGLDGNVVGAGGLAAIIGAINLGGFAAYQTTLVVANTIARQLLGHGLRLGANAALARGMAVLAGPVGVALAVLLSVPAVTGTAYRVTIPCIIQVAYMRKKTMQKDRF